MNNRMDWWAILLLSNQRNSTTKCAYSVDHFPTNVHFVLIDSWWIAQLRRRCVALGADVTQPPIKVSTWHVMYCLLFLVAQPLDRLSFVNLALFFLYSCLSLSANFSFLSFSTIDNNPPPTIPTWLHFLLMDCVIRWWLKAQRIPAACESELGWRVFFIEEKITWIIFFSYRHICD